MCCTRVRASVTHVKYNKSSVYANVTQHNVLLRQDNRTDLLNNESFVDEVIP